MGGNGKKVGQLVVGQPCFVGDARFDLWAMPGLNWRPLPCQGSALPLRQPPEVETGFEPVYTDLQSVASPLGHSTTWIGPKDLSERTTGLEPATLTLAR